MMDESCNEICKICTIKRKRWPVVLHLPMAVVVRSFLLPHFGSTFFTNGVAL